MPAAKAAPPRPNGVCACDQVPGAFAVRGDIRLIMAEGRLRSANLNIRPNDVRHLGVLAGRIGAEHQHQKLPRREGSEHRY
jgi:hypothetical protein